MNATNDNETSADFLNRLGTNGMEWAKEIHARFPSVSVDDLLGWCCNMIEMGRDAGRREATQPGGDVTK